MKVVYQIELDLFLDREEHREQSLVSMTRHLAAAVHLKVSPDFVIVDPDGKRFTFDIYAYDGNKVGVGEDGQIDGALIPE